MHFIQIQDEIETHAFTLTIDRLFGRTDDIIKVKGTNIFPGQIDEMLREVEGTSSEYQVIIDHLNGKDIMTLFFEIEHEADKRI